MILAESPPQIGHGSGKYLGNMTTPLSMIFIGIVISMVEWKKLKIERDILFVLAGRFLVTPALMFLLLRGAICPLLMNKVFLLTSPSPR